MKVNNNKALIYWNSQSKVSKSLHIALAVLALSTLSICIISSFPQQFKWIDPKVMRSLSHIRIPLLGFSITLPLFITAKVLLHHKHTKKNTDKVPLRHKHTEKNTNATDLAKKYRRGVKLGFFKFSVNTALSFEKKSPEIEAWKTLATFFRNIKTIQEYDKTKKSFLKNWKIKGAKIPIALNTKYQVLVTLAEKTFGQKVTFHLLQIKRACIVQTENPRYQNIFQTQIQKLKQVQENYKDNGIIINDTKKLTNLLTTNEKSFQYFISDKT